MLAGALPRLASAVLQPPALAAGLATGILGAAAGVGSGVIPVTDAGPRLTAIYECPDSNRVVTRLAADQKVLVTARTSNGAWLQLYLGEPDAERGWTRATSLQLPSTADALPVADCVPSSSPGTNPGSSAPDGVPTAITGTPAAAGPTITDLIVGYPSQPDPVTGHYVIGTPSHPCNGESQAFIDVQVTDPTGIKYVGLAWTPPDGSDYDADMEHKTGNLWEATIEAEDGWSPGIIEYQVFASGASGSATLEWSASQTLELRAC